MKPMTADKFKQLHFTDVLDPPDFNCIALALEQLKQYQEAHRLLLVGVEQAPPNDTRFDIGFDSALGWAQGLFAEIDHATDDAG